uniref:Uncharacterized protein n=1 Tax=Panagrolaimus sp. JU765 TaxID=591449 RepID=A0AC34RNU0_9BILA
MTNQSSENTCDSCSVANLLLAIQKLELSNEALNDRVKFFETKLDTFQTYLFEAEKARTQNMEMILNSMTTMASNRTQMFSQPYPQPSVPQNQFMNHPYASIGAQFMQANTSRASQSMMPQNIPMQPQQGWRPAQQFGQLQPSIPQAIPSGTRAQFMQPVMNKNSETSKSQYEAALKNLLTRPKVASDPTSTPVSTNSETKTCETSTSVKSVGQSDALNPTDNQKTTTVQSNTSTVDGTNVVPNTQPSQSVVNQKNTESIQKTMTPVTQPASSTTKSTAVLTGCFNTGQEDKYCSLCFTRVAFNVMKCPGCN